MGSILDYLEKPLGSGSLKNSGIFSLVQSVEILKTRVLVTFLFTPNNRYSSRDNFFYELFIK